jgi:type I restriction enzyme S subunit
MALSKFKIGKIIEVHLERCDIPNLTVYEVAGINKDKEFFTPTVQVGEDTSNYKIVPPNYFACNLMHVGRDFAIPIAINKTTKNVIVSPAYSVFCIVNEELILRDYFYMILKKIDFDRYAAFCTDSSIRDGLEWSRFCEIEIEFPSLDKQQEVVDVYLAMLANQKACEKGLEDLRITYEAYIENLRKKEKTKPIINYLLEKTDRNINSRIPNLGVSKDKKFIVAKRDSESYENYKIVRFNEFAYRPVLDNMDSPFTVALNQNSDCAVSPAYIVFSVNQKELISQYLMIWLSRKETERWIAYNSWGSARNTIELNELGKLEIPIPELSLQHSIIEIYKVYEKRKEIAENLKKIINDLCPILIKGSVI